MVVTIVERQTARHEYANAIKWANTAMLFLLAAGLAVLTVVLSPPAGEDASFIVKFLWLTGSSADGKFASRFPPLSWLPLVLYGLVYGRLTLQFPKNTARLSAILAVFFGLCFIAVRLPGGWGNLTPVKPSWFRKGAKEFLWTDKYPPDLPYIFLFTGINHFFITLFQVLPASIPTNQVILDIGTSPFIFYFVHMWTLMIIGAVLNALGWTWTVEQLGQGYSRNGVGNGLVYWCIYFGVVMWMWFVCRRYGRLKAKKSADSLWRYF